MSRRFFVFASGLGAGVIATLGIVTGAGLLVPTADMPEDPIAATSSPDPPALVPAAFQASDPQTRIGRHIEASAQLANVLPSVVRVRTSSAAGSGVIIDPSGVVLTSAHLVGDNTQAHVVVGDARTLVGAVTRLDMTRDLALLKLPPGSYRSARLGESSDVVLGAPVSAIGYPLNLAGPATASVGIVSRVVDEPESQREMLQTDAAVNIGSSGGPIITSQGHVIGVIASVLGEYKSLPTAGISYAVSVETIRDFLGQIDSTH